jgi:hypothetical protein
MRAAGNYWRISEGKAFPLSPSSSDRPEAQKSAAGRRPACISFASIKLSYALKESFMNAILPVGRDGAAPTAIQPKLRHPILFLAEFCFVFPLQLRQTQIACDLIF